MPGNDDRYRYYPRLNDPGPMNPLDSEPKRPPPSEPRMPPPSEALPAMLAPEAPEGVNDTNPHIE